MFCDSHLHLSEVLRSNSIASFFKFIENQNCIYLCSSSHSKSEFVSVSEFVCGMSVDSAGLQDIATMGKKIKLFLTYGIHPQNPKNIEENAEFLEKLLVKNKIVAIGEIGFDLFTDDFKKNIEAQRRAWDIQLFLAEKYQKPILVHVRKAINLIFEDTKRLKKLPSVIFHSFSGSRVEATSILNRGISAFFSFGKQVLNNNKKVIDCVANLPLQNILLETDAPFQTLKDEAFTKIEDISRVYDEAIMLKRMQQQRALFSKQIQENFLAAFCIKV